MEDRKFVIFAVLFLAGLFIFSVPSAKAYGIEAHAYLTSEIINFYNQNYSGNQIPSELRNYLIDGSRKEDEPPRWVNHFYDPIYDRGLDTTALKGYKSKDWAQDAGKQNEITWRVTRFISSILTAAEQKKISEISADANFTWNRAIEFYANGETEKAMFALGHVLHLIEDAGVPDHTRNDAHPEGSPYESFAQQFNINNSDSGLSSRLVGRGTVSLNNLDAYFNSLASYSNNNFYSKDTIGIQSGYNLPQPIDYEVRGNLRFARGQDEQGFYKLFTQSTKSSYLIDLQSEIIVGHDEVMTDYWNHLSPKVVQHGAGVINLFFQEAEKAEQNQQSVKKDKNFLTRIIDAAKAAVSQIFNKTSNKPAAVIDVSKQSQQNPAGNLTASVIPVQNRVVSPQPKQTLPQRKETASKKEEQKKEEKKQVQAVKQEVRECSFNTNEQPSHHEIIINEVAWMGGLSSAGLGASDEWIELKNLTNKSINIAGWQIVDQDENIQAIFKEGSSIPASGFYLLERTSDSSVSDVTADTIYTGALANSNEGLRLFASDCTLIDEVFAKPNWPAGDNSLRRTMQREKNLSWTTYGGSAVNDVFGTPKAENGPALAAAEDNKTTGSAGSGSGGSSGGGGGGFSSEPPSPTAANVLITEVQITGGPGQTDQDFIEIYNHSTSSVNLNGHRLVKRTKTGTSDTSIKSWTSDTIIPAGGYYLWANNNYSASGTTPDVTTSATISNDNGIAIRFGAENTGTIIDSIGWGEAANTFVEGAVFATNPGANESVHRKTGSDFVDTNNNANDFELTSCPSPKASTCAPPNQAPSASLDFSPAGPTTSDEVIFSGASSTDPDGSISYYLWEFGDNVTATSTNATTSHIYTTAGSYTPRLTVVDNGNASATASVSITINDPAPPPPGPSPSPDILFQQSDDSGEIYVGGGQFFSLGSGADGSANKLKIKFKPQIVNADGQYYAAPWRIRENGGAELDFWYAASTTFANQPKYCFTTTEGNAWKDIIFTFSSAFNFLASKTYDVYLLYLRDEPGNVCAENENVGTGNNSAGWWAANASNTLIYFQIGN